MPLYKGELDNGFIEYPCYEKQKIRVPSSFKWKVNNNINYEPFDVFRYPEGWNEADSGIIARDVHVQAMQKERVFLIFKGVLQKWKVFINNIFVYESNEGFVSTELDVTEYVKNNEVNNLKVWCGPFDTIETDIGVKSLVPNGSWFGNMSSGIWQDVFIEYRNETYIEDVFINTSVRRGELKVDVTVRDKSECSSTKVIVDIFDSEERLINAEKVLSKETFDVQVVTIERKWESAEYWSPDNPKLFRMVISIEENGQITDSVSKSFGFREFWLDKHKFVLNGKRINLKGDCWHYNGFAVQTKEFAYNYFKMCKENEINFVRLHAMPYPDFYLDAADAVGMLIVDESAIYGSHKNMQADHSLYIENCKKHLEAFVRRDRNHPSVIIWSMQNEMRWVDGREGYKDAMKELIGIIKKNDSTRQISFDGDNRLVDYEHMEIVSMHYNIDGTIRDWKKDKPLAFGEHGKWHYISPQVCAGSGGEGAYLSFDSCMTALGLEEQHFNEYARKEEVTALCPFNTSNYMLRSMPEEDVELYFEDLTTPGPKPRFINKHSLTINNGLLEKYPRYTANPSLEYISESFKAVTVIPKDYNRCFYGTGQASRGFNIYNDTEYKADSKLLVEVVDITGAVKQKEYIEFTQNPGERYYYEFNLKLGNVKEKCKLTIKATLSHGNKMMDVCETEYKIYPEISRLDCDDKKVGYAGDLLGYKIISQLISAEYVDSFDAQLGNYFDVFVLGPGYNKKLSEVQPVLNNYVNNGGFLIVLDQKEQAPGDLTLSGKRFPKAFINTPEHPIFEGLSCKDFELWDSPNIYEPNCRYLVENAFNKPVSGDCSILLHCGEGDFGWGGLLWTPMVEYRLGLGGVILSQLRIGEFFHELPTAAIVLRNMLKYSLDYKAKAKYDTFLAAEQKSKTDEFISNLGIQCKAITSRDFSSMPEGSIIILDCDFVIEKDIIALKNFVKNGGKVLVMPAREKHEKLLTELLEEKVIIRSSEVYQLKVSNHSLCQGISNFDTYNIEKVTYSPPNKYNSVVGRNTINFGGQVSLFESVKNPWHTYFIKGCDTEYMKIGVSDITMKEEFTPECYGAFKKLGKGEIIISNIEMISNDKVKRIYTTLLSNIGADINTKILTYLKSEIDIGIPYFMALPYDEKNDYETEERYFSAPDYVLNNLGEGVYGWMKRVEKQDGFINIPDSRNKTFFLTLFIESEVNRNPEKRADGELPDSSIVPDLFLDINRSYKIYVNGKCYGENNINFCKEQAAVKVEDVTLDKGINRVCLICHAGEDDCKFNMFLKNKYGDSVEGIRYILTLD